ncbi:2OG-Fe(II) oxygenase [Acinetobacter baumannii]|uniref:Oxidoreductase n=1 Tax=Acinetobacter baumannii TaxID=470 RepID=A0A1S2G122_ACIBA|nr:2OG-Fe(II) oxygenase [Acinetobacter baumannii]EKU2423703.1 2OG-Fe(II) oxygenase [Acinetobacter baumannii]EKV1720197.1 2OG-Fe(II) oxygenase [Acinetobacter baumannii]MCE6437815.1 2OG-Fe(II) oxygenase [Acinetobacter baumannii]MCE6821416.1 2OG-Fe(II) oxygenase [Acinetobacter baumannii]MCE6827524.1 2OG-Fe(II) oxygenase [Acinetobacter baumannii]
MHSQPLPDCWNLDQILDNLNAHGFAIVNQAYSAEYHTQVAKECSHHFDEFREAGIQNGVVSTIRSDHILWINESLPVAEQHVETLTSFCQHLNQAFFLGIKEVEAHFACYNPGEFYALHRDNPQQKNDRIMSTVYYLHPEWQDEWGGQLRLQDKNDIWHIITPEPNRLVIFQSNLLHEVLVSKQQRLSITAWLRSGNSIWV